MKIIDLLNKIANEEEIPKKIHIKQFQCDFIYNSHTYLSDEKEPQNIYWYLYSDALNYEAEILEEKKIPEKLEEPRFNKGRYYIKDINGDNSEISGIERTLRLKINEIIDYLKSKGDE